MPTNSPTETSATGTPLGQTLNQVTTQIGSLVGLATMGGRWAAGAAAAAQSANATKAAAEAAELGAEKMAEYAHSLPLGMKAWMDIILNSPIFQFANAGLAAVGLFSALRNVFAEGFNAQTAPGLVMAAAGAAGAVYGLGMTVFLSMSWAAFMPYVAAALAVIIVLAFIFGHPPTPEETGIGQASQAIAWNPGPILFLASTAAFTAIGYNFFGANLPTQPIPITKAALQQVLPQSVVSVSGTPAVAPGQVPYGVPIMMEGADGKLSRVAIISRSGINNGQAVDQITVYDLDKKYVFVQPDPTKPASAYTNIMNGDKPNPAVLKSFADQQALLTTCASGVINAGQCQTAVMLAGSMNKNATPVVVD